MLTQRMFIFIHFFLELITSARNGYDLSVDFWSLGCILYEMLSGSSPFIEKSDSHEDYNLTFNILYNQVFFNAMTANYETTDLLAKLLEKEPTKRIGSRDISEIKLHIFFK